MNFFLILLVHKDLSFLKKLLSIDMIHKEFSIWLYSMLYLLKKYLMGINSISLNTSQVAKDRDDFCTSSVLCGQWRWK